MLWDFFDKENTMEITLSRCSGTGFKGLTSHTLLLAALSCHIRIPAHQRVCEEMPAIK
jgi:hypothetical protein